MLTPSDRDLLDRRRKSLRHLKLATWALPVLWVGGVIFALTRFPALVDPVGVSAQLDGGVIDWPLLRALARVAPMLFLGLLLLVSVTVFIFLRGAWREHRLLQMVERAERGSVSPRT
ncbi:MAG: hypothetical protein O2894_13110 [Planctomycetota bacterium]|nr:hypothetical protein [Planctomycetota bacterium]